MFTFRRKETKQNKKCEERMMFSCGPGGRGVYEFGTEILLFLFLICIIIIIF